MSRCEELIRSATDALQHRDPARLYEWVQHLDSEYGRHRYPELLVHALRTEKLENNLAIAIISAVEALKLAIRLQFHTHSRRVLAAACLSRALADDLEYWQQCGLKQPLWSAAFRQPPLTDAFYFTQWCLALAQCQWQQQRQPLTELLCGFARARYWLFAEQLPHSPTITTGSVLQHQPTQVQVVMVSADASHWLVLDSKRQTLRKLPLSQLSHWQPIDTKATPQKLLAQLEYLRALSQHLPSVTFKAPKPLLTAIKRYTSGTGALEPVINHIAQRPILAQSLRQAVEQQQLPANDPHRMQLKHIYLWLGGTRAAIILATASLQQQFLQQRVPLQQSLMQRLNLLTELLTHLSDLTGHALPTPPSLLTLLTAADLFRDPRLLRSARWPRLHQLDSADKEAWLGPQSASMPNNKQRLSRQLIARWQLDKPLAPLLQPEQHTAHPLPAMMTVSNVLVAQTFHYRLRLSEPAQEQFENALTSLKLSSDDARRVLSKAISRCHPYSPLTEFSHSQ